MKQTKTTFNRYLINFGHFFSKAAIKLIFKDKTIIKIPIRLTKKLKTSNLPQEIDVRVKYNKTDIPNIINMTFP